MKVTKVKGNEDPSSASTVRSPIRQTEGQTIQSDFPDGHAETSRAAGVLLNPKRRRFVLWLLIVGGLAGLIIAAALKMGSALGARAARSPGLGSTAAQNSGRDANRKC
jgi:hypothetical protein